MGHCHSSTINSDTQSDHHSIIPLSPIKQINVAHSKTTPITTKSISAAYNTFDCCIRETSGLLILHDYLISKYTEQHSEFIMELQQYKRNSIYCELQPIYELCERLYNKYIVRTSTHAINITDSIRESIHNTIYASNNENIVTCTRLIHCYDTAERDVLDMIQGNYWFEFSQTPQYIQWLNNMNNCNDNRVKQNKSKINDQGEPADHTGSIHRHNSNHCVTM